MKVRKRDFFINLKLLSSFSFLSLCFGFETELRYSPRLT